MRIYGFGKIYTRDVRDQEEINTNKIDYEHFENPKKY